jgi:probable rRNA maturation factor
MITIQNTKKELTKVNKNLLKFAVQNTLDFCNKSNVDLSIRLTDDNEIMQFNKKYRDVTEPTDVLAFNQDFFDPETGHFYIGDIIISVESVSRQAPEHGLNNDQECAFLAIHGTLHLLGYDHYEPEEKEEMWRIQDKIILETLDGFQEKTK